MGRAKSHVGGGPEPMYLEYNTKQQTRRGGYDVVIFLTRGDPTDIRCFASTMILDCE
jgi:hypothetical protein